MKLEDFMILVKGMRSVYTSDRFLPDKDSAKIWYSMLQDIPYDVLSMAIQKYMSTSVYPPTIADLRRLSAEITTPSLDIDAGQSFQEARKMIQTYGRYRREDALANMTPITRKVVERMGYDTMCDCENIEVERGQFTKIFDNLSQRERQDAQLPNKLKELITSTTMKLEDKR